MAHFKFKHAWLPLHRRQYATTSRHAQWYTDIVPSMIPVFLLGSAVYLGLQLTQLRLANEKFMDDSARQIKKLEDEITALREKRLAEPTAPPPTPSIKKRSWLW